MATRKKRAVKAHKLINKAKVNARHRRLSKGYEITKGSSTKARIYSRLRTQWYWSRGLKA